jgi:endonuclease G, mitochondrial
MKKLLLSLFLIPLAVLANPVNENCPQFVAHGAPQTSLNESNTQYLCRLNYAVHYRNDTKTAEWVAERITLEDVNGKATRRDNFRPDPEVPEQHRATLQDYAGTGYDRGHLAPAAANTQSAEIMSESFLLTNMVPQNANKNRGIWRTLELAIRSWVRDGKDIWVVTGTVYEQGHLTIGNNVGVPTHMWKVIYDAGAQKAIAFYMPNQALPRSDLHTFAMSVRELEQRTGINFHPNLPENLAQIETRKPDLAQWPGIR